MKKSEKKRVNVAHSVYLVLHDIRSVHNVGSIFRTADAGGVSHIFLTGHTPTPLDRFGRPRSDIAKVALGAEKEIPWKYVKNVKTLLKRLVSEGVYVVAIEQYVRAIDYRKIKAKYPIALVFGNEVKGIPSSLFSLCDAVAEIPMSGRKESLNVSVAAGIALFRILGR